MGLNKSDKTNAIIGVDMAHYAVLNEDTMNGTPSYGTIQSLPYTKKIGVAVNDDTSSFYYDDAPTLVLTNKKVKKVTYEKSGFSNADISKLLGKSMSGGILLDNKEDNAPYIAFGFRTAKSNGAYRYVWLLKGKLAEQNSDAATAEESKTPQNTNLAGDFVYRESDGNWRIQADTDDESVDPSVFEKWFDVETLNKTYEKEAGTVPPDDPEDIED